MTLKHALRSLLACWLVLHLGVSLGADSGRGPTWSGLNAAQKQALAPLQRDWSAIDDPRKQKWLEVAARFPTMSEDERARVRERMTEWARLTPTERARARLQFQEAQQVSPAERQARWNAYQSLSPEERNRLAQRAKPATKPASAPIDTASRAANSGAAPGGKRNLVQTTSLPPSRAVLPTVVQAKPGATTTSMATKSAPPAHHQTGLPKIAATPGFVDPATLLPKRGPQGAAVRSASTPSSATQP